MVSRAPLVLGLVLGSCAEPVQRSERAALKPAVAAPESGGGRPGTQPEPVEMEPATGREPAAGPPAKQPEVAGREPERRRMVEQQLMSRGIRDPRVLAAMLAVPRHRFVTQATSPAAYADGPLPIVGGQTISQPYIVAFMSEAASIEPGERCLEIGTGSGYQAAVLAELCGETYSIEYLPEVAAFGRRNLERLGYLGRAVSLRVGDGYAGWPEKAPFDAILVTAAPEQVPAPLLEQLAPRGRLIIPVGEADDQRMEIWIRRAPGNAASSFERTTEFPVRFVPFLGPNAR